jgi:predicted transcriptional regulator
VKKVFFEDVPVTKKDILAVLKKEDPSGTACYTAVTHLIKEGFLIESKDGTLKLSKESEQNV